MAPPPWMTPEQRDFLVGEDAEWLLVKAGSGKLKGFYARTANTFLEKWPVSPSEDILKKAGNDAAQAQVLVEEEMFRVSRTVHLFLYLLISFCSACLTGTATAIVR